MQLRLQEGLLYVDAEIEYRGKSIRLSDVIVDTGSLGTLFSADSLETIGLIAETDDRVLQMVGVGGTELVFVKKVDSIRLGSEDDELELKDFRVEVGAMDYGFPITGIVGLNLLLALGAIIDLSALTIHRAT